jgi:hypothetical protein
MVKKNGLYVHYKNKKIYLVDDICQVKINGEWKDGVIYSDNTRKKKYVREINEFLEKFELVGEKK